MAAFLPIVVSINGGQGWHVLVSREEPAPEQVSDVELNRYLQSSVFNSYLKERLTTEQRRQLGSGNSQLPFDLSN